MFLLLEYESSGEDARDDEEQTVIESKKKAVNIVINIFCMSLI